MINIDDQEYGMIKYPICRYRMEAVRYFSKKYRISQVFIDEGQSVPDWLQGLFGEVHPLGLFPEICRQKKDLTGAMFWFGTGDSKGAGVDPIDLFWRKFRDVCNSDVGKGSVIVVNDVEGRSVHAQRMFDLVMKEHATSHRAGIKHNVLYVEPKSWDRFSKERSPLDDDFEVNRIIGIDGSYELSPGVFFDEPAALAAGYSKIELITCILITGADRRNDIVWNLAVAVYLARRLGLGRIYLPGVDKFPMGEIELDDGLLMINRENVIYDDEQVILSGPFDRIPDYFGFADSEVAGTIEEISRLAV